MNLRSRFESQMLNLNKMLIEMGETVEQCISMATVALADKNMSLAREVIATDRSINEQEKDIESLCLKLLLHQQPVAKDLRMISAALKMITDMERIGDQCSDICDICLLVEDEYIMDIEPFRQMGNIAIDMVHDSIEAFVKSDRDLAGAVLEKDDIIDKSFVDIKDALYKLMLADVNNSIQPLDLLMIAKYYERIGDHAENLAEWVIFSITGEQKPEIYSN